MTKVVIFIEERSVFTSISLENERWNQSRGASHIHIWHLQCLRLRHIVSFLFRISSQEMMDGSFQRNVNKCRLPNKKRGKPFDFPLLESGRRGSNPRPSAWKANALSTELLPQFLWAKMDSNHRSRKTADLQSAPFGHSGICPFLLLRRFVSQLRCKDTTIYLNSKQNRSFLLQ